MPEQITKFPDVTKSVLESAGARCGQDAPAQEILTKCPKESFCALTGGEVCIYGIEDIPHMTQIEEEELAQVVCPDSKDNAPSSASLIGSGGDALLLAVLFFGGWISGRLWHPITSRFRR